MIYLLGGVNFQFVFVFDKSGVSLTVNCRKLIQWIN